MRIRAFPMTMDEKIVENIWQLLKVAIQVCINFTLLQKTLVPPLFKASVFFRRFNEKTIRASASKSSTAIPTQWCCTSTARGFTLA